LCTSELHVKYPRTGYWLVGSVGRSVGWWSVGLLVGRSVG